MPGGVPVLQRLLASLSRTEIRKLQVEIENWKELAARNAQETRAVQDQTIYSSVVELQREVRSLKEKNLRQRTEIARLKNQIEELQASLAAHRDVIGVIRSCISSPAGKPDRP